MFIHSTWRYAARTSTEPLHILRKKGTSGEHMFVIKAIFLAFAQTLYPFSKDFPWFKPNFLPIWPMSRDSFWRGVRMGPTFTDFLFKIHPFGRHIPMYLTYVKFLPLGTCRGTQIFLISSIYGMHRYMRISQPNYEKGVGKGHLFEQAYVKFLPPRHKL